MKESKIIIIVSMFMFLLIIPGVYILRLLGLNVELCVNIVTNLCCGLIVALITAICQYHISKRQIINTIYGLYFDLYRTYYYSKNKTFLFHYNSISICKKIVELSPKINSALGEYCGFFKTRDSMYRKMNPIIQLKKSYKAKNFIKLLLCWFNKKIFNDTIESFMVEVEKILINIDEKRFSRDKEQMIKMFNYMWK